MDKINSPKHYTSHPSGIEPIEITKYESFCIGNAIKYIMRHKYKGDQIDDLRKAIYYLDAQIKMYEQEQK